MRIGTVSLLLVTAIAPLSAQASGAGRSGPRPILAPAEERALARSAAPASISADATVWLFTRGGWVVGDSGTSGAACLVSRSWPESLEPECFDPEAAATIMPIEMRRTELLHQGMRIEEVDQEIARELMTGRFRLPSRMAVAYMMSARQRLVSDDGTPAGAWRPHLMIYSPFLTNAQVGHQATPGLAAGMVVDPGLPTANLMVVVPAFAEVPGAAVGP